MKSIAMLVVVVGLTGCGLNPKQMEAIDGAMCNRTYGVVTVIVGGASKGKGVVVNGDTCSVATQGAQE